MRGASPDDLRVVSVSRRPGLVVAALLLACGRPNPVFELDLDATGGAGSGTGTTPTTGSATATTSTGGTVSITGITGDTSSSSSVDTTDGIVTSPGCGQIEAPCGEMGCCEGCGICIAGTCKAGAGTCGPCESCGDDGLCAPRPEASPCELAEDPCGGALWGLDGGTCFANAPGEGVCDVGGVCQPQACAKGEALVVCDFACILDPGNCEAGMPAAQVDPAALCVQDGETAACNPGCLVGGSDAVVTNVCKLGVGTAVAVDSCGKYTCKDAESCNIACDSNDDCKVGFCDGRKTCQ